MHINSKKGLYQGLSLEIVAVIIMFLTASIGLYSATGFSKSVSESAPQISCEYPKVIVNTFLMQKVSKEDSKKIFNDNSNYLVRDLIWYGTEQSLDLARGYSNDYLNDVNSKSNGQSIQLYKDFSKDSRDSIIISKRSSELITKDEILKESKYVIITKDDNYIEIVFGRD